ncbi:IS1 transposase [Escherichia coli]|nr:IS1 transposase [Escherichia coli]RDQ53461.1 IS1 transposase [Escherichia coli]
MAHSGAGVHDTCQKTENRHQYRHTDIKKPPPRRITSAPVTHADVALICEPDEQWCFAGSRAQQHWLWYACNTKTGGVLAYTFGPRNDETCQERSALLTPFCTGMVTSDDRGSYAREKPKEKHLTGKIFTQRIERNNLPLRTRIRCLARKTICFSRSVEIHEKVIGSFIEKHMFY